MSFIGSLIDIVKDMFHGGWIGCTLAVFIIATIAAVILAICVGILAMLYHVVDSWYLPEQEYAGFIYRKNHSPASTSLMPVAINNGTTTSTSFIPIYTPESWSVVVRVQGQLDEIGVSKSHYGTLRVGQRVTARFVTGRMSGGLYVRGIS